MSGAAHAETARAEAVWADAMLVAALLAVDPGLGGVMVRAGPGPVRDAWLAEFKGLLEPTAPWRRLPPGVEDDRLLGGVDLSAALGSGRRIVQRGLLAEADGGVLVAAMAERMSAGTAARLAAALDGGRVAVERDGIAAVLPARFVLAALDESAGPDEQPPEALSERLPFRLDLDGVGWREATSIAATPADVAEARAALARVEPLSQGELEALCGAASALGVESLRGSLMAVRVARALAALEGREAVDADDLRTAARLVLAPRATRRPEAAAEPAAVEPAPETAEPRSDEGESPADGAALDGVVLAAALAALPEGIEALWRAEQAALAGPTRGGGAGAPQRRARRGRVVGVRAGKPNGAAGLNLVETLKAAAPWQRLRTGPAEATGGRLPMRVRAEDFRLRRFEQRAESTVIFVVDASGSAALHRLAEAKGAVELLLAEAYVRRTQAALLAFRGEGAELLLPPTRSLARARRCLGELAGGGATPLAAALAAAGDLAAAERAKRRTPLLVILTDGRGNIALDGAAFRTRAETDALVQARAIRAAGVTAVLIDTSPRPRPEGARLAEAMGAQLAPLPYVDAGAVVDLARAFSGAAKAA
jgi:magnesium chelatase subunit D